ncbi:hypothetical protein NMY22_g18012 [Coprinellus aureogranulatus]|nr:hypothetical protein NMY22_g18012 [Coprinellus aureogranulatus]
MHRAQFSAQQVNEFSEYASLVRSIRVQNTTDLASKLLDNDSSSSDDDEDDNETEVVESSTKGSSSPPKKVKLDSRWPLEPSQVVIPRWDLRDEVLAIARAAAPRNPDVEEEPSLEEEEELENDILHPIPDIVQDLLVSVMNLLAVHIPPVTDTLQNRMRPVGWEHVLNVLSASLHGREQGLLTADVIKSTRTRLEQLYGPPKAKLRFLDLPVESDPKAYASKITFRNGAPEHIRALANSMGADDDVLAVPEPLEDLRRKRKAFLDTVSKVEAKRKRRRRSAPSGDTESLHAGPSSAPAASPLASGDEEHLHLPVIPSLKPSYKPRRLPFPVKPNSRTRSSRNFDSAALHTLHIHLSPIARLSAEGVKQLDQVVANAAKSGNLPTFVFGVTNLDEEIYFNAHGHIDFHDPSSPHASPDSIFWICSMTKLIASIATLQLIDRSLLTLDTPISHHLPSFSNPVVLQYPFKIAKPAFKPLSPDTPVRVRHLLNHSSGLYYDLKVPEPWYAMGKGYTGEHDREDRVGGFVRHIQGDFPGIPLKFEPGSSWTYGWSSDILGFLVEAVTGLSFEDYCQENIFKPLGIRASFYLTPTLRNDLVRLTFRDPDGKIVPWAGQTPIIEQDPEKVFAHLGGVGLYTSMRDYLKLPRHILRVKDNLPVQCTPLLSQSAAQSLFKPTLTPRGSSFLDRFNMVHKGLQFSTGLALMGEDVPGMRRKGSGWWGGWAGTQFFLDPTSGIAVVFGSQLVPPGDEKVVKLQRDLEKTLYANLEYDGVRGKRAKL